MKLLQPLPARIGNARVFVIELGINGIRVLHQGAVPKPGSKFHIDFEWEARRMGFECEVVHNDLQKLAKSSAEKSTYNAGAHIVGATADSAVILRKLLIDHIERALDEQRANARGIPAKAAQAFQTGKAREFIRCELVNGKWRRSTSTRTDQPQVGFTVSSEEEPEQIDMLCESYATGDESTRMMIRMMAEASLASMEGGIPTRKYTP